MGKTLFNLLVEPRNEVYRRVIDVSSAFCDSFLLVEQQGQASSRVLKLLEPFLIRKSEEHEWPGTRSMNLALVWRFRLGDESKRIVKERANGLYDWRPPTLPEDLCLLRPDGSPWLVSISHESDCYFELTTEEKDFLEREVVNLGPLVMNDVDKDLLVDPDTPVNERGIHVVEGGAEEAENISFTATSRGFRVFRVGAQEAVSEAAFIGLIAKAVGVPQDVDADWGEIGRRLRDLSWLPGKWYVLIVERADMFCERCPSGFESFLQVAEGVINHWWEARVPFHLYLIGGEILSRYDYSGLLGPICRHPSGFATKTGNGTV